MKVRLIGGTTVEVECLKRFVVFEESFGIVDAGDGYTALHIESSNRIHRSIIADTVDAAAAAAVAYLNYKGRDAVEDAADAARRKVRLFAFDA